ncbi:hypothetical protein AMBLS11_12490 [Alteromonas macleodii str. 'Black Sea 11']|nr:hypothetical protein AMBLS11_12490 [Alteromonas macleodii str. 'Black Sea 11']
MECTNTKLAAFFDLPRQKKDSFRHRAFVVLDAGDAESVVEQINDLVSEFKNVEVKPVCLSS